MTKTPAELLAAKEWRLYDEYRRANYPWRTRFETGYAFIQDTLRFIPFVVAAVLIIREWGLTTETAIAAAVLIFERRLVVSTLIALGRASIRFIRYLLKARSGRRAKAELTKRMEVSAERLLPKADDTFAEKPIMEIARKIAESGQPVITKESLAAALDIPVRKADDLRTILLNSQFLLYPITTDVANTRPIGSEMIAFKDEKAKRATTIHPTLMNAPAEQRALVIANAIRRTLQFSVGEEPRIVGEPSPACQYALGVTGSHLASAQPEQRRVPVRA